MSLIAHIQPPRFPRSGKLLIVSAVCLVMAAFAATLAAKPTDGNLSTPLDEGAYTTGQFLVATPNMSDPRFSKTVIFMVKHDETGAMGLVINRPLGSGPLDKLLKGFGVESGKAEGEVALHFGGPVRQSLAFILHSTDYIGQDTLKVDGASVAMTGGLEILEDISLGQGPEKMLVMVGYSGWGAGQLEGELRQNTWVVVPADAVFIFDDNMDDKWQRALERQRIDL